MLSVVLQSTRSGRYRRDEEWCKQNCHTTNPRLTALVDRQGLGDGGPQWGAARRGDQIEPPPPEAQLEGMSTCEQRSCASGAQPCT